MNIDKTKFRLSWWEDAQGNLLQDDTIHDINDLMPVFNKDSHDGPLYYHCTTPCQLSEEIYRVDYFPKTFINKLFYKLKPTRKYIQQKIGKTFRPAASFHTTFSGGSDCIVAMVNSGDYTLSEAIYVYANACEACMNVICYKYLDGKQGYPEYSEEWFRCNTLCQFCEYEPLYARVPYNPDGQPMAYCEATQYKPTQFFPVTSYGVNPHTNKVEITITNNNKDYTITIDYECVLEFASHID